MTVITGQISDQRAERNAQVVQRTRRQVLAFQRGTLRTSQRSVPAAHPQVMGTIRNVGLNLHRLDGTANKPMPARPPFRTDAKPPPADAGKPAVTGRLARNAAALGKICCCEQVRVRRGGAGQ